MYYIDNNSGSPNMPPLSPAQSNTPTWFTEGDKNKGISWIGQDWLNILQAELLNVLSEAGIKPDKGKLNQLTLSIKAIITANAYTRANNLKEIFDAGIEAQAAARDHLGLGKLATKDSLGAGDVDAVSRANGGTFENDIAVTGTVTSNQVVVPVNQYPGFTTSVSAQAGSQAPFYLGQVTLNGGDIFIPYIKESTVTPDGKKAVISFGFNKGDKKTHASPAVHVATEDGKYQLWEFDTETGRLINNATGGVALLSELAPVKKAIDDTQTGLAAQGVMWITSADDLSNLPSGARRFARNNTGVTVLPSAGYFFLEVLAKRDTANGSCILATSDTRDVWIGFRYTVPDEAGFTWIQLNQNVENLGLTDTVNRASHVNATDGDLYGTQWGGWLSSYIRRNTPSVPSLTPYATTAWVNQTFVRDVRAGNVESAQVWRAYGYNDQAPYVITGVINGNTDDLIDSLTRRPLQKNINGVWYNIGFI